MVAGKALIRRTGAEARNRLSTTQSCLRHGHVSCAMPVTFMVIMVIFESGMFGSMGAVASIVTIPLKPEQ